MKSYCDKKSIMLSVSLNIHLYSHFADSINGHILLNTYIDNKMSDRDKYPGFFKFKIIHSSRLCNQVSYSVSDPKLIYI